MGNRFEYHQQTSVHAQMNAPELLIAKINVKLYIAILDALTTKVQ